MIYLVEDDGDIRKLVEYALASSGFEIKSFPTPSEFYISLENETPSLILLDIMLPEEDGLSILKKLRAHRKYAKLPIIMLTAKSAEYDKVIGLDLGADDYIAKPFGMMELIARIKALLRRAAPQPASNDDYACGTLTLSPQKHLVKVNGEKVDLSFKEFELLKVLFENRGNVLSRDTLLNKIWGYCFDGESRTVDVHVRHLRQKLGDAGACIETIKGVGYKIGEPQDE